MVATEKQKQQFKERYQKNKEKVLSLAKTNYNSNKERILETKLEYVKNNTEKITLGQRDWYLRNRELKIEKSCKYVKENKIKHTLYNQKRRGVKKSTSDGSVTECSILNMLSSQNEKCIFCKDIISHNFHIDHIIPLCKNGFHSIDNMQLLCPTCNLSKGKKNNEEFIKYNKITKNN